MIISYQLNTLNTLGSSTPTKHVRWRDDVETSIEDLVEPSPREIRELYFLHQKSSLKIR